MTTPNKPPRPNISPCRLLLHLLLLVSFLRCDAGTRATGSPFVGEGSLEGSVEEDSPRMRRLSEDIPGQRIDVKTRSMRRKRFYLQPVHMQNSCNRILMFPRLDGASGVPASMFLRGFLRMSLTLDSKEE